MAISKLSTRRGQADGSRYSAPLTVSAPSLLQAGSDRAFQRLIFNLFTISARIEQVRSHLSSRMGISPPQYSLLRAVWLLQGEAGVSIGIVAEHLQVTSTFVAVQSRLLAQLGCLSKKESADDRRVSLLSLTPKGERLIDQVIEQVRPINDTFFGTLRRSEFDALCDIMEILVDSSRSAVVQISSLDRQASLSSTGTRRPLAWSHSPLPVGLRANTPRESGPRAIGRKPGSSMRNGECWYSESWRSSWSHRPGDACLAAFATGSVWPGWWPSQRSAPSFMTCRYWRSSQRTRLPTPRRWPFPNPTWPRLAVNRQPWSNASAKS